MRCNSIFQLTETFFSRLSGHLVSIVHGMRLLRAVHAEKHLQPEREGFEVAFAGRSVSKSHHGISGQCSSSLHVRPRGFCRDGVVVIGIWS